MADQTHIMKQALRKEWLEKFTTAVKSDQWGQVVEAQETYHGLASAMERKASELMNNGKLKSAEMDNIHRLVLCLSARYQSLNFTGTGPGPYNISTKDLEALIPVFEAFFTDKPLPDIMSFPVPKQKYQVAPITPHVDGELQATGSDHYMEQKLGEFHNSHQAVNTVSGTVICFRICEVGLKDAPTYIDAFVTVSVVDEFGNILFTQDTGSAKEKKNMHVIFNETVYLTISLEDCQRREVYFFFEFKHYKPKKKKVSTRCFAFMEMQELQPDTKISLEIYHKPTSFLRKNLKLHSVKPLYLHVLPSFISK